MNKEELFTVDETNMQSGLNGKCLDKNDLFEQEQCDDFKEHNEDSEQSLSDSRIDLVIWKGMRIPHNCQPSALY